jgi:hypothetical protein
VSENFATVRVSGDFAVLPAEPSFDRPSSDGSSPDRLTPSDRGRLPEATRKVLVQLLRGPYVSQERHAKSWAVLLRAEDEVREHLGDLFLELVLDSDAGVAFVRNMESDEVELPRVVRSQRLTLIDTALVLFLREQLLNAEATGRRVFVGQADIIEQMSVYRALSQIDESGFNKRVRTSIEKMKDQSVLLRTAEEDRFEVSPILRLVFDADQVIAVIREIRRLVVEGAENVEDVEKVGGTGAEEARGADGALTVTGISDADDAGDFEDDAEDL